MSDSMREWGEMTDEAIRARNERRKKVARGMEVEVEEMKQVWVVWTNGDRTEGRGIEFVLHVCSEYETAVRLGKCRGSNCRTTKETAFRVGRRWFVPGYIEPETKKTKSCEASVRLGRKRLRKLNL